jgi:Photosynthesis affected mutant 68
MGRKSRLKRENTTGQTLPLRTAAPNDSKIILPNELNGRILKRGLLFSGLPFGLALMTLPTASYLITVRHIALPNAAVFLVSLLFFGLSVVGVTYSLLSSSWDPQVEGSFWGIAEFKENGKRIIGALQEEGVKRREEKTK